MKNILYSTLDEFPEINSLIRQHPGFNQFMQRYEINTLPPGLRDIVSALRTNDRPMTAGEIAEYLKIPAGSRQVSVQLKDIISRTNFTLQVHRHGATRGGQYTIKKFD